MKPRHDLFNRASWVSLAEGVPRNWYSSIREAGSGMQRGNLGQESKHDKPSAHRAQLLDEYVLVAQNFDNLSNIHVFEYLLLWHPVVDIRRTHHKNFISSANSLFDKLKSELRLARPRRARNLKHLSFLQPTVNQTIYQGHSTCKRCPTREQSRCRLARKKTNDSCRSRRVTRAQDL